MAEGSQGIDAGFAASRYSAGFADREPYLVRARRISKLTLPYLFREQGYTGASDDVLPWQSLGGYCVSNLAEKLVDTMFPADIPFIGIVPSDDTERSFKDLPPQIRGTLSAQIDKALSKEERKFVQEIAEDGDRAVQFDTALHMVVGGSHALHVCDDATLSGIPLEQFVTWRDRQGRLTEFVIEDPMSYHSMPEDVQAICRRKGYGPIDNREGSPTKGKVDWDTSNPLWSPVKVYTHGEANDGKWSVYTEVMGEEVPGSRHPYLDFTLPYLFLRMISLKNEPYGRSYCEGYEADLQTYDAIWQALTEGGAILARVITLIRAGGTTNKDAYSKAANGAVITGDKDEVAVVQAEKGGDLEIVFKEAEKIEERLSKMFILNSAVQRSGERVTATEISYAAIELNTTLGGVYANQVTTWQKPYAVLKIGVYRKLGRLTKLPKGTTKIVVITGEAALGRMKRAQDTEQFLQIASEIFTPPVIAPYIDISVFLERGAANRGIDSDGLVKSKEQVQQEQQAEKMDALTQQVAPQIAQQGGQMLQNTQTAAIDQNAQAQAAPPPDASQGQPAAAQPQGA